MKRRVLIYDGGTYALRADVLTDLVQRGVLVLDADSGNYALGPEHVIEEVEPAADVLSRLTGSVVRAQERPDAGTLAAGLKAPNGFGGRR